MVKALPVVVKRLKARKEAPPRACTVLSRSACALGSITVGRVGASGEFCHAFSASPEMVSRLNAPNVNPSGDNSRPNRRLATENVSSIYIQYLSRNVRCHFRGEEKYGLGDFFRPREAAQWNGRDGLGKLRAAEL